MNRRAFLQRSGAGLAALAVALRLRSGQAPGGYKRSRPRPTAAQLAWQRDELALFLHFGVNTFTDREWGDGREDPAIFAPAALDARAWAQDRAGRRLPGDDPHRQASRRLLSLADQNDDALRREKPVARRPRRRGARVRRRLPGRRARRRALSVAVGPQPSRLRRLAALQRRLRRSAHRAADAVRPAQRSVVRRRQRRRAQREAAGLRLAAHVRPRQEAAAECRRSSPTRGPTSAGAATRTARPASRTGPRSIRRECRRQASAVRASSTRCSTAIATARCGARRRRTRRSGRAGFTIRPRTRG